MATYVDTRTAADNELSYQGLIRCAVCNYIVSKDMWRLGEKVEEKKKKKKKQMHISSYSRKFRLYVEKVMFSRTKIDIAVIIS